MPPLHRPGVILYVEDDPTNRALLRAVLDRTDTSQVRDARLLEADSLASARRILEDDHVDVVLLDVRLPDGSGLELASELRRRDAEARPAVIVMSASVLPDERHAAIAAGADAFMPKPFVAADLIVLIAERLASRSA